MTFWKRLISSRKFWATAVATAVPILNELFGWKLSTAELLAAVTPLVVYVLALTHLEVNDATEKHEQ